jgi:hypothetical protein
VSELDPDSIDFIAIVTQIAACGASRPYKLNVAPKRWAQQKTDEQKGKSDMLLFGNTKVYCLGTG